MDFLPYIIDLGLIAIFVIKILDGRRTGFVKLALSIAAMLLGAVIAAEYCGALAQWANDAFIRERAIDSIAKGITDNLSGGVQAVLEDLPDYIVNAAQSAGIEVESLLTGLASNANVTEVSQQIYTAAEGTIVLPIVNAAAFILIYIICYWLCSIVISIINRFFKLPILKSVNRILGAVLGAVKGVFSVGIISVVLYALSKVFSATPFAQAVADSNIQQFIWNTINSLFN